MFRKWISFVVVLAFVATTMPSMAHATMPHDDTKLAKSEHAQKSDEHEECHHDTHNASTDNKTASTDHHDSSDKNACCDGKFCKCVGNACNSTVSLLGFGSLKILSLTIGRDQFGLSQERMVSSIVEQIKHPPRA